MNNIKVRIDVALASAHWVRTEKNIASHCRRSVKAALTTAQAKLGRKHFINNQTRPLEISVVLASDARVRKLNHLYRGQDKPTNVLSFPSFESVPDETGPILLGDVILAFETTRREAKLEKKSLKAHTAHLVIHGILHLLGYDHIVERDARKMERLEQIALKGLGITDPYAETTPIKNLKERSAAR